MDLKPRSRASSFMRGAARFATSAALITVVSLGLLEALVAFGFRHPTASPIPLPILRQLHVLFDRNTIQVMPECAVYDDRLTYILKPGECTFSNREFSNRYYINSLGLRDDEESLERPEVVILGDSIAMGWGVEQDEIFASVYERLSGRRTLNAGISSYGTVRELRLFERVDRRYVKDLVIQYSANDFSENRSFLEGDFKVLSREQYEHTVSEQSRLISYHPGKHALNLMVMLRNAVRAHFASSESAPVDREAKVKAFLHAVEHSPVNLDSFRVTVVAIDSEFIERAEALASISSSAVIRNLRFVDLGPATAIPEAFYVLDDHPTRVGHEAIGRALLSSLEEFP